MVFRPERRAAGKGAVRDASSSANYRAAPPPDFMISASNRIRSASAEFFVDEASFSKLAAIGFKAAASFAACDSSALAIAALIAEIRCAETEVPRAN